MYMSWTRWVRGQVESCRRRSREEGSPELLGRQGLGLQPRAGVNLKLGFTSAVGSTHTLPLGRWWFFDGGIPVDPLPCLSPPPSVAGYSRSSLADISLYLPDKGTSCACACLSAWVYLLSSWPPCRHLDQCVIRRVLSTCLGLWNPLPMTVCKLHRRDKMRKSAHEPLEPGVTQETLFTDSGFHVFLGAGVWTGLTRTPLWPAHPGRLEKDQPFQGFLSPDVKSPAVLQLLFSTPRVQSILRKWILLGGTE